MSQHQFLSLVTALLPWWRTSQRRVLALAVPAMVLRPRATLSGLARALPATAKLAYRLERLGRSVSNPRLDLPAGWAALAHRATSLRPTGWLPPPLDDTALREGLMWAPAKELGAHRERLVVLADRGSAVSRVFRWCRHPKVRLHFVVRLLAKVHVQWEGFKTLLSSLEVEPGSWLWLPQLRYGPERALPNVLVVWRHGCKGPWRPASSLEDPRAIYRLYRRRMRIEALFKDAKGYFWPEECWRRRGGAPEHAELRALAGALAAGTGGTGLAPVVRAGAPARQTLLAPPSPRMDRADDAERLAGGSSSPPSPYPRGQRRWVAVSAASA